VVLAACVVVVSAGCGVGEPWPHSDGTPWPTTSGHRDVLVMGDSLAGQTSAVLPNALAFYGMDATVTDAHVNGSGLVGTINGQKPVEFVSAQLDAHPETDMVVAQWAGACARPCTISYGSDAFDSAWFATAEEVVQLVRSRGITLVWAIPPPPPPGSSPVDGPFEYSESVAIPLSFRTRGLVYADSIAFADWWVALDGHDDFLGHYEQHLFYADVFQEAAIHQVRADDLVHFTHDGSVRAANWTAAAVADHWNDTTPQ
jgi:hypothetical protein